MNNPLPAINIGDISQIQGSKPLTGSIEKSRLVEKLISEGYINE